VKQSRAYRNAWTLVAESRCKTVLSAEYAWIGSVTWKAEKETQGVEERRLCRGLDWLDKMVVHKDRVDQSNMNVMLQRLWTFPNCRTGQRAVSNTYKDIRRYRVDLDRVGRG
jgi:hypothetical protein